MCSYKNSTCELQTTHFVKKKELNFIKEMFLFSTFNTCMKIAANIALIKFQTILYYWVVCVVLTVGGGGIGFGIYLFSFEDQVTKLLSTRRIVQKFR